MTESPQDLPIPLIKFISMWALIGITSWADFAAFLGAIYSMFLISEWLWKKYKKRKSAADKP